MRLRIMSLCVSAFMLGVASEPARAHAIIVSAHPEMNAVVAPGVTVIKLEFNSRIDPQRSRLRLLRPDGSVVMIRVEADTPPNVLAGRMETTLPGRWTIDWQVLSIDGHITRGRLPFSIRGDAH